MNYRIHVALLAVFAALASVFAVGTTTIDAHAQQSPEQVNDALGIGINLGNTLELQREGVGGITLKAEHFQEIADAGFGHVRVPIQFTAYADTTAPYLIPNNDPTVTNAASLWERIDWVLNQAQLNGLGVILDMHAYAEISDDVSAERDRFLAVWEQIATRYADAPSNVLFELLNEPRGEFNDDPGLWNSLLADAINVIRDTNPDRVIVVGPAGWNGIYALVDLELPNDPNLIVSVHFYDPFPFTHQGAHWEDPVPPAPSTFDANTVELGHRWFDWSWRTDLTPAGNGMAITYEDQGAGLNFGYPTPLDPASLQVEIVGDAILSVRCFQSGVADGTEVDVLTATSTPTTFSTDMSSCPTETDSIAFVLDSPPPDSLVMRSAEVCDSDGECRRLVETAAQSIESSFDQVRRWAATNGVPVNLGEFGVYANQGVTDLNERVEWTSLVRNAAYDRGFSLSYWEFGAGFGAYDLQTETWIEPVLAALAPVGFATARGDVNCDAKVSIADALIIAQYTVGNRTAASSCPVDQMTEIYLPAADLDRNGIVSLTDVILIARCTVGNIPCPE